ncbi:MAG TPA: hypothetical protein PKY69_06815 [Acetomicrobium flavidum]|uniref:hypothetical protein n=1 Tax=Acetomicrobium flavidum TaxID=49896 RepID=UPI002C7CADB5|nr:hypothetical protein [Acetomicrobium flavidum]HOP88354.1 hypothetical protein [Acetomicrobium flavidum]
MKRFWIPVMGALLLVLVGSSAFAFYGSGPRHMWGAGWGGPMMWDGWCAGPGYMFGGPGWYEDGNVGPKGEFRKFPSRVEVPAEIAQKMRDLERAQLELRMLFLEDKVDQKKAKELHEKMISLRTDISRWQFEQRLKQIDEWQKKSTSSGSKAQ